MDDHSNPDLIMLAVSCMVRCLPIPREVLNELGEGILNELQEAYNAEGADADSGPGTD